MMRLTEKICMIVILFHGLFIYFPTDLGHKPIVLSINPPNLTERVYADMIPDQPMTDDSTIVPFVVSEKLKPQVEFWKKVFSQYSRNHMIIHDSWYLNVIFEVVDVESPTNKNSLKDVVRKYEDILKKMSDKWDTPSSMTEEERRIFAMYERIPESKRFPKKDAYQRIRVQAGHSNYFKQGIIRSGKHMAYIKRVFKEYGLPEQLSYLPMVESSFNDHAISYAGAVGMWQFMNYTGKQFDLTIDELIDERKDPRMSTVAAARLLSENYKLLRFWPLAITAYNHGAGGMKKAIQQTGSYQLEDIIEHYDDPRFGFASRNFYAELLAAIDVYSNYQAHFGDIDIHDSVSLATVTLPHYVSVKTLEEYCRISSEEIKRLNPALLQTVFEEGGMIPKNYNLNIPSHFKEVFLAAYDKIPPDKKFTKYISAKKHKIQPGETLATIAAKYNISAKKLASINSIKRLDKIVIGRELEIPGIYESLVASANNIPETLDSPPKNTKTLHHITGQTNSVFGKSFPINVDHQNSSSIRTGEVFQHKSGFMTDSFSTGYKPDSFFKMSF